MINYVRAPALCKWFGRPFACVKDLVGIGLISLRALQQHFIDKRRLSVQDVVYPVSLVFPMGFAWSSYIAQHTMLELCRVGGFGTDRALADDVPPHRRIDSAFAMATDDVMVFTRSSYK